MVDNSVDVKQARQQSGRGRLWQLRGFLALSLIWLVPIVACGSFAPRPTPTPTPLPMETMDSAAANQAPTSTPIPVVATPTFTPAPTPTFTPTPAPGTALLVGQPARISAPNGLNMRGTPNTTGQLVLRLSTGQRVVVLDGPTVADGFTWWQIDDQQGNVGWAAEGDGETTWITPRVGEARPVNRDPRVGDLAQVTTEAGQMLTVRALPGTDAAILSRVDSGNRYSVIGGPQVADGFTWFQIRADNGSLEGWAAVGDGTTRWLSPLE
jgi:hypothetical protein